MTGTNPVGTWEDPDFSAPAQTGTKYKGNIDNTILTGKRIADAFAPHEIFKPTFDFVPADVNTTTDRITETAHTLENDQQIQLTTDGTLPAGLSLLTTYFIVGKTANDFQLSLTSGGAAVDITDQGTGTHTLTAQPSMHVRLDTGGLWDGATLTEVAEQITVTIVAPTSNPRIDRGVIDRATGVVSVITGAEAPSPVPPAITAGKAPICQISLTTSQTAIPNTDLTDERALVLPKTLQVDTIDEFTAVAGVTVDGLLIKDGTLPNREGAINGIATLDGSGDVPDAQIPNLNASKINAGTFPEARIGAAAITRPKLKTTTGEVSRAGGEVLLTLPGGQYGFYVETKHTSGGLSQFNLPLNVAGTSFLTQIAISSTGTGTARQRFIQASPPYDLGNGQIPLFIFAVVDSVGKIESIYVAPDPPWANNGPTDIRADFDRNGKAFKLVKVLPPRPDDPDGAATWIETIRNAPLEEIEITQAVKQADMPLIPYPFTGNDLTGKTVVLLDPIGSLCLDCLELHETGESVTELLHGGYIEIGNTALERETPPGVIAVSTKWKNTG